MKIGVLGLQGDVREHLRALEAAGAVACVVKRVDQLAAVDALVLPGGESTTIGKLLDRYDLLEPLRERVRAGMPLYGTCAGAILMATDVTGSQGAPHRLRVMDIGIERNAYGRQVESFETDLRIAGLEQPFRGVFIRAPIIRSVGDDVEVLAETDGSPVLVRQGHLLASTFHPEMTPDARVHDMFVKLVSREKA